MKKVLLLLIIINLIVITFFQSILSASIIYIGEEKDNLLDNDYKNYFNCIIRTDECAVDGRAFLFPGYLFSWLGPHEPGANVKRASGMLIAEEYIMGYISFNDDKYYGNWEIAYVFSFNGHFDNYYDRAYKVFEMNGTAKFVRVYYS